MHVQLSKSIDLTFNNLTSDVSNTYHTDILFITNAFSGYFATNFSMLFEAKFH